MRDNPLRRITPYLVPFWRSLSLMVIGALGAQVLMAFIPILAQKVIDDAIASRDTQQLRLLVTVLGVVAVLEGLLLFMRRFTLARAASMMEMRMRHDLYAHLQRLSLNFHEKWQSGQLLSRAMSDTKVIFREFVSFAAVFFVANVATFIVVFVMLVSLHPVLAIVTSLAALPIAISAVRFQPRYRRASRVQQDSEGDLGTFVEEAALGIRVITTFGRADVTQGRFDQHAAAARDAALEANVLKARFVAQLNLVSDFAMAIVLGGGAIAVANGTLSVGGLVAFLALLLMLVWPVKSLGEIFAITHKAASGAERIFEVFDANPDIVDAPSSKPLCNARGHVELRDISFAHVEGHPVLHDVSLVVEPGEMVAIVGRTGSGKTSLCALIPRLVDVDGGAVLFDGVDVRDATLTSVRDHVAVGFEEPLLFSASVRENLLLGRSEGDDGELERTIEVAQAQFVYELPWGLDSRIGEQGISLSGGQRQRLALARAILFAPRVLVLDDPLSALDVNTEALVHEQLKSALVNTTTIITAHRPSTVTMADRVAFLDGGRIVAVGTHAELLASVAAYGEVLGSGAEELV